MSKGKKEKLSPEELAALLKKVAEEEQALDGLMMQAKDIRAKDLHSSDKLKAYYLSKASFFNSSGKIFLKQDSAFHVVEDILRSRASKNPGGASDQTVRHFKL